MFWMQSHLDFCWYLSIGIFHPQHDIVNELEQVCNALGTFKSTCQTYVLQYGPVLINYLVSELVSFEHYVSF